MSSTVVTEVGPGVTAYAPGDRVMGTLDTAFAPLSVADARLLAPVPDGWTDTDGASATVAFLTAYYGLVDLGGLSAGRRVLIHCGAGIGRTGTLAVCVLVALGQTRAEAEAVVRAAGSQPETPEQHALVGWWAGRAGRSAEAPGGEL